MSKKTFYNTEDGRLLLKKENLIGMTIGDFLKEAYYSLPENKLLIQGTTRYAFAFAVSDSNDNFLFFDRDFAKIKKNNESIPIKELIYLNLIDLPIASRSLFPDSPFKTPGIASCVIKEVEYVGKAFEEGKNEDGVNKVIMPIFHIIVEELPLEDESLLVLTKEQLTDLQLKQITKKTMVFASTII